MDKSVSFSRPHLGRDVENVSENRKRSLSNQDTPVESKLQKFETGHNFSVLTNYVAERKGEREEMQDAHVTINDCTSNYSQFVPSKAKRVAYYAVFDGHGGSRASLYAAKHLHVRLSEKLPSGTVANFDKEFKRQVMETFRIVDEEFLKLASQNQPAWKDGTTACCVLILDDTAYIANLGDSKAVLCRFNADKNKHIPIPLSREHNPTNYEERMRIQKSGGTVREGRVLGILEVSRSIGDGQYKRCGVINVPELKRCRLTSSDRFIIIACDGLWKVFKPDEALEFVLKFLNDKSLTPPETWKRTLNDFVFQTACNKLASEAVRKGSADNVTVIIIGVSKQDP